MRIPGQHAVPKRVMENAFKPQVKSIHAIRVKTHPASTKLCHAPSGYTGSRQSMHSNTYMATILY